MRKVIAVGWMTLDGVVQAPDAISLLPTPGPMVDRDVRPDALQRGSNARVGSWIGSTAVGVGGIWLAVAVIRDVLHGVASIVANVMRIGDEV